MAPLRALTCIALIAAAIVACHRSTAPWDGPYDGTCRTSLQSACEGPEGAGPRCLPRWSGSSCPAVQSCEGFLAMPDLSAEGVCVFDPHTHELVAWMLFGIDTPPWCAAGVPGLTVSAACLNQWWSEGRDCGPRPFPSPTYCCPGCPGYDAAAPTLPVGASTGEDGGGD